VRLRLRLRPSDMSASDPPIDDAWQKGALPCLPWSWGWSWGPFGEGYHNLEILKTRRLGVLRLGRRWEDLLEYRACKERLYAVSSQLGKWEQDYLSMCLFSHQQPISALPSPSLRLRGFSSTRSTLSDPSCRSRCRSTASQG
jgi:hypothetical protein